MNWVSFEAIVIVTELVLSVVSVTAVKKAALGVSDIALMRKVPQSWPAKTPVTPSVIVKAFCAGTPISK